eukprot:6561990-Lingulodinium_polyedra.AAC.1
MLAMRVRLPQFRLPYTPIEVWFVGLGGRRGVAADMDEKAVRVICRAPRLPGGQSFPVRPLGGGVL